MADRVQGKFDVTSWEENPFDDKPDVAKLTEALVERAYTGDLDGASTTKWLMAYAPDKTASFVGLERFRGTVSGKKGSLVLQHVGSFSDGVATAALTVVSGTDELKAATGSGEFTADPAGSVSLELDFG
jgi:hypothetical protein